MKEILIDALTKNQLNLEAQQIDNLLAYLSLLSKWNRVFNLTSITAPSDMVYLHLIDSLLVSPYLVGKRCLDVGTGAGLPGIPLAIIRPDTHWTLLDKSSKKTRFLNQAVAELGLENVSVAHARSEDYHSDPGFDTIVSRAFGSLKLFVETTQHLLAEHGQLIAMKGKLPHDELSAIRQMVSLVNVERLAINGMMIERHLICLRT